MGEKAEREERVENEVPRVRCKSCFSETRVFLKYVKTICVPYPTRFAFEIYVSLCISSRTQSGKHMLAFCPIPQQYLFASFAVSHTYKLPQLHMTSHEPAGSHVRFSITANLKRVC